MSSERAEPFPIPVIRAPKTEDGYITFAFSVHDGFNGSSTFPNPDPTLTVFLDHINQLQAAQSKALGKGKGTATARNAKKALVKQDIRQLCAYVQKVIPTLGSPADARAAITSVFFSIKRATSFHKPPLVAKNTSVSGTVALIARSVGPNSTYYWEYSADGKTWIKAPDTLQGKTTISGLTSATTYAFRFRALTRKGPVGYSQVVTLIVH